MVIHIAAVLTCHNRRQNTLQCLNALFAGSLPSNVAVNAVLMDDGSADGTAEEVRRRFPSVIVIRGTGELFWNRGMHAAQAVAMKADPDFIFWLNDDTELASDGLSRMLQTYKEKSEQVGRPVIVVGATVDRASGDLTYGGMVSVSRLRRFTYKKIWHSSQALECEVMNGNAVLIPRTIVARVGNLDPTFEHAMGDLDYALRVRRAGFQIFVNSGVSGYCSLNNTVGTHRDLRASLALRWARFLGRKGLPATSWMHFVRQHGGVFWPLYFIFPYVKFGASSLIGKVWLK